jgi:hypothetical protein
MMQNEQVLIVSAVLMQTNSIGSSVKEIRLAALSVLPSKLKE